MENAETRKIIDIIKSFEHLLPNYKITIEIKDSKQREREECDRKIREHNNEIDEQREYDRKEAEGRRRWL